MVTITGYADEDRGGRQDLEDLAYYQVVKTASGLHFHLGIVCDVDASDGATGERAVRRLVKDITDSIINSTEITIPKVLSDAIKQANSNLYNEFTGAAIANVALAAIDVQDTSQDPLGRMYIASVGDTRIYLIRDQRLTRLNIDHIVSEELFRAGQMDADMAKNHPNAAYPTRALGAKRDVEVDIGFYRENGQEISSRRAFEIGKAGMPMRDGDTILLATDGVFHRLNETDPQWTIPEERFRHYALHNNVEQAVKRLKDYAISQKPHDNTALTLMYVPSNRRNDVDRIRWYQDRRLVGLALVLLLFMCAGVTFGLRSVQESQAVAQQATEQQNTRVAFVFQLSATATATPTASNTPTRTARPTQVSGLQIGIQLFPPQSAPSTAAPVLIENAAALDNPPIYLDQPILSSRPSDLLIEGVDLPSAQSPLGFEPVNAFMREGSLITIRQVNNQPSEENAILSLFPSGDLYANLGNMVNGGIEINMLLSEDLAMTGNAECMAARQIPRDATIPDDPEKVAFTCFKDANGLDGSCNIRFPEESGTPLFVMPIGQRVLVDITNNRVIETTDVFYSEMVEYYERVRLILGGTDKIECLLNNGYLDPDGDSISHPVDRCPFEEGTLANQGCAADRLPDVDGDGLDGDDHTGDVCPFDFGPPENFGCPDPITLTPTPTLTPSFTPSLTLTLTPMPTDFIPSNTPIPSDTPIPTSTFTPPPAIPTIAPTALPTATETATEPAPPQATGTPQSTDTPESTATSTNDPDNSPTPAPSATPTGCFQVPNPSPGCGIPPVIITVMCQNTPEEDVVNAEQSATCRVTHGGTGPFTYNWELVAPHGGNATEACTTDTCTLTNIIGQFRARVTVTNAVGNDSRNSEFVRVLPVITAINALQTQNTPPNAADNTAPYEFAVFADLDFTLQASILPTANPADDAITYRWFDVTAGDVLVGTGATSEIISTVTSNVYRLEVSMSGGTTTGNILVRTKPRIVTPLLSSDPKCRDPYTFTTSAVGDPIITFSWQRFEGGTWQAINGGNIVAGCTVASTTCTLRHFSNGDFNYRVVALNGNGQPAPNNDFDYAAPNVSSAELEITGTCSTPTPTETPLPGPILGPQETTPTPPSSIGN